MRVEFPKRLNYTLYYVRNFHLAKGSVVSMVSEVSRWVEAQKVGAV